MCHSTHPRCQSCNARTPRHRCHCPSNPRTTNTITPQQQQQQQQQQQHPNTLPPYSSLGAQTASPLHGWAMQPVAPRAGRSCGHERRCRGPVRMLVGYLLQKHQDKKAREVAIEGGSAAFETLQQERGVVEIGHEKEEEMGWEQEKGGEVKVVAKSVSGMSL